MRKIITAVIVLLSFTAAQLKPPKDSNSQEIDTFRDQAFELYEIVNEAKTNVDRINFQLTEIKTHSDGPFGWMVLEMSLDVTKSVDEMEVRSNLIKKLNELKSDLSSIRPTLEDAVNQLNPLMQSTAQLPAAAKSLGFRGAAAGLKSIKTSSSAIKKSLSLSQETLTRLGDLINNINDILKSPLEPTKVQKPVLSSADADTTDVQRTATIDPSAVTRRSQAATSITTGNDSRKSITSVESVWIKPGALEGVESFEYAFFDKMIDFYVEVERFDYNVMPETLLSEFRDKARALNEVTPESIGEVLNETIGSKILEVLNSPDVQENRGLALRDEAAWQGFAATKGRSLGLTVKELEMLLNSAYIYLPYIHSMTQETDDEGGISVEIKGGILWYQLKVDKFGSFSVEQLVSTETEASGSASKNDEEDNFFYFADEKYKVSATQEAHYSAIQAWSRNLGVKTKEINVFRLQAQIVEASGNDYGFGLGYMQGIYLDDVFHLVEFMENDDGEEIAEKVGFVRVRKTGNNIDDPTDLTYATQLLGETQGIGGIVMEHPRLGFDMRFGLGFKRGLSIPSKYTNLLYIANPDSYEMFRELGLQDEIDAVSIFEEDASNALQVDMVMSYNLAPIIGISQTFMDLTVSLGVPTVKYTQFAIANKFVTYEFDVFLGFTKKFWMGRSNASGTANVGYQGLNITAAEEDAGVITIGALAVKIGGSYEYLINPDVSINAGLNVNIGFPPLEITATDEDGETETYTGNDVTDRFPNLYLGGVMFNLGLNYSLTEFSTNIFGKLDGLKKH